MSGLFYTFLPLLSLENIEKVLAALERAEEYMALTGDFSGKVGLAGQLGCWLRRGCRVRLRQVGEVHLLFWRKLEFRQAAVRAMRSQSHPFFHKVSLLE